MDINVAFAILMNYQTKIAVRAIANPSWLRHPPNRSDRPSAVDARRRTAYSLPMSRQSETETGAVAEAIPECPHCHKPLPLCVCDSIVPIESAVSLLILQHPQEQDIALGTARLTALHFKNAVVKIGLSWPSLSKAL
jgi:hypothetical protein